MPSHSDGGSELFSYRAPPPSRRSWLRTLLWILAVAAVMALAAWGLTAWRNASAQHGQGGPGGGFGGRGGGRGGAQTTVGVAKAEIGSIPIVLDALGTVTPVANVTVRTRIAGVLEKVEFHEGQMVKQGQLLALVDPRPYQIAVQQAQGQLLRDQALLANAKLDLQRYQKLLSEDSIARQQTDTQASLVKQYEGAVAADQAALNNAKLNLEYCHVTAPVSGRVGLRKVDPGNFVQTGDADGVVVIAQIAPIDAVFAIAQAGLPQIEQRVRSGAVLTATAYDQSDTNVLAQGRFLTFDNEIDPTTGTVKAKARFDNKDGALFPSQFVNVHLLVDTLAGVVTIPTAAVRHGAPGDFVYTVTPDHIAHVKSVKLGPTSGESQAVLAGLEAGELVVTDGGDRLKDGAPVLFPGERPRGGFGGAGGFGGGRHGRHGGQAGGQGGPSAAQSAGPGGQAQTGQAQAGQGLGGHGQSGQGQGGWQGHGGSGHGHWSGQHHRPQGGQGGDAS